MLMVCIWLAVPNEFSGQIVVEKEGFKEIHIIKDGKAIQKYNVRVYPDGREVSVDDEFAVVPVQDGTTPKVTVIPIQHPRLSSSQFQYFWKQTRKFQSMML